MDSRLLQGGVWRRSVAFLDAMDVLNFNKKTQNMGKNIMQIIRLVMMVLAIAGVIYALEFMESGIAVWFWVTLLGVGFVGLLYSFRITQRRVQSERRVEERHEKKRNRKAKR